MSEWISIKDKLPYEGRRVLIWTPSDGCIIGNWNGRVWVSETYDSSGIVTHRMPLPSAPMLRG